MSERGIRRASVTITASAASYSFLNAAKRAHLGKFHFRTQQGIQNLTDAEPRPSSARIAKPITRRSVRNIEAGNSHLDPIHPGDDDAQAKASPSTPST